MSTNAINHGTKAMKKKPTPVRREANEKLSVDSGSGKGDPQYPSLNALCVTLSENPFSCIILYYLPNNPKTRGIINIKEFNISPIRE